MSNDDICYLTASAAPALFRTRKLSPLELRKALIARAEQIHPKVNCFADSYHDDALEQAKRLEARYMRRNARTAAFEGIPLAVKDAQRLRESAPRRAT